MKRMLCILGFIAGIMMPMQAICEPGNSLPTLDVAPAVQADLPLETKILFSQPYESKELGRFTVPFGWEISEKEGQKRIIITETRETAPAVLTVDLVSLPKKLDEKSIINEIASLLSEQLGTTAKIEEKKEKTECGKAKCPTITYYQTEFSGKEKLADRQIDRICALEMVPVSDKMLVFTICAESGRTYNPGLREILHQIFMLME